MHRKTTFFPIALALTVAFMPLSRAIVLSESLSEEDTIQSFSVGPGLANLSLGDAYATHQWGLKNDGQFQLSQSEDKNLKEGLSFAENSNQSDQSALPKIIGPGVTYNSTVDAVKGVDINILPAWTLYDTLQDKRQVVVAIIDTGIDYAHPELQNSFWKNPNEVPGDGIDNDGNGYIDDIQGWDFYYDTPVLYWGSEDAHGTHAAGTIAADKGSSGIVGITDNTYVKLMVLKTLGGKNGTGTPQSVIKAIQYAQAQGASICNLSFGTSIYNEELAQTIANSNMLFVIAAGNGGYDGIGYNIDEDPVYPAAFPSDNIISVANLMFDGNLSGSSNYGATSVDIAAPGSYILSTTPGNQYDFMSGTSMAAPMVTGVAALLYSYRTDISLSDVKNILLQSSKKLESLNGKVGSGGLIDAYEALSYQIPTIP